MERWFPTGAFSKEPWDSLRVSDPWNALECLRLQTPSYVSQDVELKFCERQRDTRMILYEIYVQT